MKYTYKKIAGDVAVVLTAIVIPFGIPLAVAYFSMRWHKKKADKCEQSFTKMEKSKSQTKTEK
jgi:multisubunit Na+/H+ antiporter MnhC subunit